MDFLIGSDETDVLDDGAGNDVRLGGAGTARPVWGWEAAPSRSGVTSVPGMDMEALLLFVAACLAMVLVGWLVSRRTGAHAYFLENWTLEDGETITWRDDRVHVVILTLVSPLRAPLRLRRWSALVTDRRILLANRTLTGKRMVIYVLCPGAPPDAESKGLGGGLLTRGYVTLAVRPDFIERRLVGTPRAHVALKPVVTEASSFNIGEIHIYSTFASTFRLPGSNPSGAPAPAQPHAARSEPTDP